MKTKQALSFLVPFVVVGGLSTLGAYFFWEQPRGSLEETTTITTQPPGEMAVALLLWWGLPGLAAGAIGSAIYSKRTSQR